jgi:hypothetical protein
VRSQTDVVLSFETIKHIPSSLETTVNSIASVTRRTSLDLFPHAEIDDNNPVHCCFSISEDCFEFLHHQVEVHFFFQEHEPGFRMYEVERLRSCSISSSTVIRTASPHSTVNHRVPECLGRGDGL